MSGRINPSSNSWQTGPSAQLGTLSVGGSNYLYGSNDPIHSMDAFNMLYTTTGYVYTVNTENSTYAFVCPIPIYITVDLKVFAFRTSEMTPLLPWPVSNPVPLVISFQVPVLFADSN